MRVWVYRPDKAYPDLDLSLLYYKGLTADKVKESEPKPMIIQPPIKCPSHYLEVPND